MIASFARDVYESITTLNQTEQNQSGIVKEHELLNKSFKDYQYHLHK